MKHIVPSIHIVYAIVTHGMERLTKCLASERFFIPISNGHDFKNLKFGEGNPLRIVFINIMNNFN